MWKYEDSPNDQWMYANLNFGGYKTGFRLLLPNAPDLELNIDLVGVNDAKDKMTVHFGVGKDCEKVRVAMFQGAASNDSLAAMHAGICLLLGVLVWLFLKGTKKLREKTAVR